MVTNESMVVMTKTKVWKGKEYTIELTQNDIEELREKAKICKLNGYDRNFFLKEMLSWSYRTDWVDEAGSIFDETDAEICVGLGATMNLWSDRRAMTIVEVVTPRKIIVQENKTKCVDYYAGDYEVLDELELGMSKHVFTLRMGGTWVEEGQPKKYGSVTLSVGFRVHYIDPSF